MATDTKNFKTSEFACKCGCGKNNINQRVIDMAQIIREALGVPVHVNAIKSTSKGATKSFTILRTDATSSRNGSSLSRTKELSQLYYRRLDRIEEGHFGEHKPCR